MRHFTLPLGDLRVLVNSVEGTSLAKEMPVTLFLDQENSRQEPFHRSSSGTDEYVEEVNRGTSTLKTHCFKKGKIDLGTLVPTYKRNKRGKKLDVYPVHRERKENRLNVDQSKVGSDVSIIKYNDLKLGLR